MKSLEATPTANVAADFASLCPSFPSTRALDDLRESEFARSFLDSDA